MATKWKNMIKTVLDFLRRNKHSAIGAVLAAGGIYAFYSLIAYRSYHPTGEALAFGVVGNLLLGVGSALLFNDILRRKYKNWTPENGTSYEEWAKFDKQSTRRLYIVGAIAFFLSLWYMSLIMGGAFWGYGWYYNLASGYMMIITALIQFLVIQGVLTRFKNEKLDLLMAQMNEINRRRLAEALEIERKSLEKVSRSDQLRVDLITNVSHDLKTPLTSMVGYIELIKKEELSDVVRDYVEVISARAEKLKEMINSLFNLAKASSGNIEFHREKFELNRLIEQIFADMEDRVKNSDLTFVTQLTEENTELVSDNTYFYRICQNLIENALKYSAKGTRVFVKTFLKERGETEGALLTEPRLCLEVTNTAGYFMDFTKDDIVERFARGDKARSGDGNGLGLAIVSTYVKALGGEFDIMIDCDQFKACVEMPCEQVEKE